MTAAVAIAKSFLESAGRLEKDERALVLDFIGKFIENPAHPGQSLERVETRKERNLWSARITRDLRAILHRDGESWLLLWADRHDAAYRWATRRRVERHAVTGVLQVFEVPEETEKSLRARGPTGKSSALFDPFDDRYLTSLGLPAEWLAAVRLIRDEDELLAAAVKLPEEVADRLMALASGEAVVPPAPVKPGEPIEASPDHLRRFWVVQDAAEIAEVLRQPMAHWVRFLHPSQRALVAAELGGPAKVTGSAGTGKTVVAMHRARHLARQGKRVLLTSFVTTLCANIHRSLRLLCSEEELSRITVSTVHSQAMGLLKAAGERRGPADGRRVEDLIRKFHGYAAPGRDADFVVAEWPGVVAVQGIATWDEYRAAPRTGRGTALSVRDRKGIWDVFARVLEELEEAKLLPWHLVCTRAREALEARRAESPFDAVIVDEAQDLSAPEISFLRALAARSPGNLMLLGDAGQRIYPGGFSLSRLGIDVRGRSRVLRVNYRTTEEIRRAADRILGDASDDLDGGSESRRGTRSVLHGPPPRLHGLGTPEEERAFVAARVREVLGQGIQAGEVALFARTGEQLEPFAEALRSSGLACHRLGKDGGDGSDGDAGWPDRVHLGTMHRAKGLEFKVVFVVGCGEDHLPARRAVERAEDPSDRESALALERQLLYVSVTRGRDEVFITWSGRPSPFLGAMG